MVELFANPSDLGPPGLRLGQAVHVNARTVWLPATITSITHARIGVAYRAAPQPRILLADTVPPWMVRPADGIRLRAVHELRAGEDVVASDGTTRTIARARQARDRWWVITYTTGERATVAPHAILRLTDPTPTVTVNGIPL